MALKTNVSQYLRGIKSCHYKTQIRAIYQEIWNQKGIGGTKGPWKGFNDANREVLGEAIFRVEDEKEVRSGTMDKHVLAMRTARNLVYSDLGWNEKWGDIPSHFG